ncbi:prepilin-type cleavage/methylation domain-containing protein [Clostridium nigeriense]|uniref:prepilin-type cleavage/methylation domain-containing protein n=1 Tax=Clostridium nigeriense TaxID=1805470 RepID=UPI000A8FD4F3|nr:prepilin-type cleavage/methylation domain-containing protein [Clostridium nigeriense]
MLIQIIVLTLALNGVIIAFKGYSVLFNNSKFEDPFDDSILNIERLLKGYMIKSIEINEDMLNSKGEILINYKIDNNKADIKKKKIFLDSNKKKIILETYNKNDFRIGVNTIMIDVSSFEIIKKSNIYYLKITNLNNDERIICL